MPNDFGEKLRQQIVDGTERNISDNVSNWFERRRRRNRSVGSRLFVAIFLIVAGTLLFLGNIGVLPVRDIWDYWPLALVGAGVGKLLGSRSPAARILSILLIVFGTFFLLISIGIFHINAHDDSWPLSLLLIAFGIGALIKALDTDTSKKPVGFPSESLRSPSDDLVKGAAIFGELKRKIETPNFEGGDVHSIFGNVVLNLRRAGISPVDKFVAIDANAVFGAIKVRVPDTWRVDLKGVAILGNYVDKTIPPTTPDAETPTLTMTGYSLFGSVEVDN